MLNVLQEFFFFRKNVENNLEDKVNKGFTKCLKPLKIINKYMCARTEILLVSHPMNAVRNRVN